MKSLVRPAIPSAARVGSALIEHLKPKVNDDPDGKALRNTYEMLSGLVQKVLPDTALYTFGSASAFGVLEHGSDIDYVLLTKDAIEDGQGQDSTSQAARALQSHLLGKLAAEIRSQHRAWIVEEVKRTRVPVLRVKPGASTPFDVSVDRRNGVRNSHLLRSYFNQAPEYRWLSLGVKHWSKRTGMNGPMGYLTSYGFNIMVVYYMLQRQLVTFVPIDTTHVANCHPIPSPLSMPVPDDPARVGSAVIDFLTYYLDEFNMEDHVIQLNRPELTTKEQLNWTRVAEDMKAVSGEGKVAYRLCIEDPYEVNLNVGRNVTPFKYDMFRRHFNKALGDGMGFLEVPKTK